MSAVPKLPLQDKPILLRPLMPRDQLKALALWQAAFGKTLDSSIWQWKYQGTFGNKCMVAEHASGELIAMFGGVPYQAHYRGKRLEVVHLWDNMSHPDYRGVMGGRRGVFVKTVDAFIDAYCGDNKAAMLYGFPGERHFRLGQHTLQYSRLAGGMVCLQAELRDLAFTSKSGGVERLLNADERLDRLAEVFDGIFSFWIRRNRRFIEWRYFQHPHQSYWVYGFPRGWSGALHGLMVMTSADQAGEGVVVDFLLPPREEDALAFLAGMVQEWLWLEWQKVRVWMPSRSPYRKFWERVGFQAIPEPIGIIPTGRSFSSGLDWTWASNNFFYTMGDGDLF